VKWIYLGSGSFAEVFFKFLGELHFLPNLLITIPPRRRGRGLKLKRCGVALIAESLGIEVEEVENPNSKEFLERIGKERPDFLVVCDYGKILKRPLLELPREVPLNVHPSLLPKYRGAAPIERAIMAGEEKLGVTVFIMDEGIDTGDILLQEEVPIGGEETKGDVVPRLAKVGAKLLKRAMEGYLKGKISPHPQSNVDASYAKKISKEELWLNFTNSARDVLNKIRALSPSPGARAKIDGILVKILRGRVIEGREKPGKILDDRKSLKIGCADGILEVLELIPEGKKLMTGEQFRIGHQAIQWASGS
jgi:methionyl-tRNA formyltransferase